MTARCKERSKGSMHVALAAIVVVLVDALPLAATTVEPATLAGDKWRSGRAGVVDVDDVVAPNRTGSGSQKTLRIG